jgi:rhodanese-related sulfurtransferase
MWPFSRGMKRPSAEVAHIGPRLAWERSKRGATLVDVRSRYEYEAGHAKGARHVPPSRIRADDTGLSRDDLIVVICSSGHRSEHQAHRLARLGFSNVATVDGGLQAWQEAALPVGRGPGPPPRPARPGKRQSQKRRSAGSGMR